MLRWSSLRLKLTFAAQTGGFADRRLQPAWTTPRSGAPRFMRGQPKTRRSSSPSDSRTKLNQCKTPRSGLGIVKITVIAYSKQHFPLFKCSESCILYLRNRHVVILSSLKLWEKGTVSIFVFTKFPFSIYFLRHFDLKTTTLTNCQYRSFARRQGIFHLRHESWFNGKKDRVY